MPPWRNGREHILAAWQHRRRIPAHPRCPAAQAGQHWVCHIWPQHHTPAHRLLREQHWKNVMLSSGAFLHVHFVWRQFRVKTFSSSIRNIICPSECFYCSLRKVWRLVVWGSVSRSRNSLCSMIGTAPEKLGQMRSERRKKPRQPGPSSIQKATLHVSITRTFLNFCAWKKQSRCLELA